MGYLKIPNLYKDQTILMFRECYALEKVHGTSTHINWNQGKLSFYGGGIKHDPFAALFDHGALSNFFAGLGHGEVCVYGEAYGGKCQAMSKVYGKELRFIAFDVRVGDTWLAVPDMNDVARSAGLDVVEWRRTPTDLSALDLWRDKPSALGLKNGCESNPREGVVLRPLIELTRSDGSRVIAKHKAATFTERTNPPKVVPADRLKVIADANEIADEWVTEMRLVHVLDKLRAADGGGDEPWCVTDIPRVMRAMIEDIEVEAAGEIIESKAAKRAISKRAAAMFKVRVESRALADIGNAD